MTWITIKRLGSGYAVMCGTCSNVWEKDRKREKGRKKNRNVMMDIMRMPKMWF